MPKVPSKDVVRISALGDLVCTITQMLGFRPADSIVIMCVRRDGRRLGLVMRFDLEIDADPDEFADLVADRMWRDEAESVIVVVFSDEPRNQSRLGVAQLPHLGLIEAVMDAIDVREAVLADAAGRWWSYLCDSDPDCGCGSGSLVSWSSASATSLAAAYALAGHAVLPDREAVVASVALVLDRPAQRAAARAIVAELRRHRQVARVSRRIEMRGLLARLLAEGADPRAEVTDADVTAFAALSADVVVRDEVLVRAADSETGEATARLLREIAQRVPPPYDAAVCTMLAWVAYSCGDGVIANIALERALASDPDYPLARLTMDALSRQLPPSWMREVMLGAADDMRSR